jgi:tetratricopeptide (TPR) repeat protein
VNVWLRPFRRALILDRTRTGDASMFGPDLYASLALAASILAPALPPRTDWVGDTVFIKKPGIPVGQLEADGTFTPSGQSRSIQYTVTRDEKGHVQVMQDGKRVWMAKDDVVRLKDAVDFYTQMLDADPGNDQWFAFRGIARQRQGKTEEALKDYAEAIRLRPRAAAWYGNRGLIYMGAKKFDEAIADFTTAIDLTENEMSYLNRGLAYSRKKEYAKAAADYTTAVERNPASALGQNQLAWLLSTAPDEKVRDGKRAVEAARKACELTEHNNGGYLDTLAAAYAETADFGKAVEWQEKALKAGDIPIKDLDAARKRLELYKQKKPYREE